MRKLGFVVSLLALLMIAVVPVLAQDDPGTIVDIAAGNPDFSTLVLAVQAAGLADELANPDASLTVFAPTNEAFAATLEELGLTAEAVLGDPELLTNVLLYHVVDGAVFAADVVGLDGQEVTTLNGETISVSVVDGGVVLNDTVNVVATDIEASNGVIHVIDSVLLPLAVTGGGEEETAAEESTEEAAEEPGTIVDIAAGNADFSTLVAAVQAAGLVDALAAPDANLTVFAPTNDAFAATLAQLGLSAEDVLGNTELLTSILLYHVVEGEVFAADVVGLDGQEVTTLNGETFTVSVVDGAVILNDTVNVVATDIDASNGVIHVIDAVLIPPSVANAEPEAEAEPAPVYTGSGQIRLAHLASDIQGVDIYIDGQLRRFGTDVQPGAITDWLRVPEGPLQIDVVPTGRDLGRAVISEEIFIEDGAQFTVAAVGAAFSTGVDPVVIEEDFDTVLAETGARITVFHGIPDAPPVDILANGNLLIGRLGYPGTITLADGSTNDGVSDVDVPAGTYNVQVVLNNGGGVVLDLPGTTFEAGNFYFVAAYGTAANPQVAVAVTPAE